MSEEMHGGAEPHEDSDIDIRAEIDRLVTAGGSSRLSKERRERIHNQLSGVIEAASAQEIPHRRWKTRLAIYSYDVNKSGDFFLTVKYARPQDAYILIGQTGLGLRYLFWKLAGPRYRILLNIVSERHPEDVDVFRVYKSFLNDPNLNNIFWRRCSLPAKQSYFVSSHLKDWCLGAAAFTAPGPDWRPWGDYRELLKPQEGARLPGSIRRFLKLSSYEEGMPVVSTAYPNHIRAFAAAGLCLFFAGLFGALALFALSDIAGMWTILPMAGVTLSALVFYLAGSLAHAFKKKNQPRTS